MAEVIDKFTDHGGVLKLLKEAQSVEQDVREIVREVHTFLDDKDGQWDEKARTAFEGRPRYTLDKCNDLVDDIAGVLEESEYNIKILPTGGEASKDDAKVYDGLIRSIENRSESGDIYDSASRNVVRAGMDGWRINQRYGDNNTFDQDLYIDPVADWVDRVWFDPNSVRKTREDAEYAFVLTQMTKRAYLKKWPDGKCISVSQGDNVLAEERSPEVVVVGEILYKVKVQKRIVELTNGAVYVDDEKFQKVKDELALEGATVERERMRDMIEVKTRLFDGSGWLTKVQDTVFDLIPLVPMYANFSIRRKVPAYWGVVTKKMDAQRIYNYTESRKVEEGALAPLDKILATKEQVAGNESQWERLNVSDEPVLIWTPDPETSQSPFKIGGANINPGLEATSQSMLQNLQSSAGLDQLPGEPLGLQSGLAVELKQDRGDTRHSKYSKARQRAICHTGKILMRAIPKVYDTERQVQLINEDETSEMVTLNQRMVDTQTGETVEMIDLSKGVYSATCVISRAYKTRQGETVNAMLEVAAIDPTIIEEGKDVLYKSVNAPGFDVLSERVRQKMLLSGQIPEDQMTDEEKEFLASQPPPPEDPVAMALREQAENESDRIDLAGIAAQQKDRELSLKEAEARFKANSASMEEAMKQIEVAAKVLNTHADTWKKMSEAMGLDVAVGPSGVQSFAEQGQIIREAQAEQP